MADEMNTERDMPEGITRDDTVHGQTYYTAADMATASAQGFRDGVASLGSNEGSIEGSSEGSEPAPTLTQGAAIEALTSQEICDIFSFLEGAVTESGYMRIVRLAEKIQTDALRASHEQAPAQPDDFGSAEHWKEKAQYWAGVAHRLRGEALRGEPVDGIIHPPMPLPQAAQQAPTTYGGCPECGFKSCVARQCTRPGPSVLTNITAQQAPAAPSTPEAGGWMPIESISEDDADELLAWKPELGRIIVTWLEETHPDADEGAGWYEAWSHKRVRGITHGARLLNPPLSASPTIEGESNV